MIPIYLCEDCEEELLFLKRTLENYILIEALDFQIGYAATSPDELLMSLPSKGQGAVYFLDVDLGTDMNGIELAAKIRRKDPGAYLIFTTTHEELAMETFRHKVEALDYLIKDSSDYIPNVLNCLLHISQEANRAPSDDGFRLRFPMPEKTLILRPDEIYYIEAAESHKAKIHTASGIYDCRMTLREISESWDGFFQCHRSVLVNPSHIRALEMSPPQAVLDNGSICPCSVRQGKRLQAIMQKSKL